jgi:class 3 adenylate cyclase
MGVRGVGAVLDPVRRTSLEDGHSFRVTRRRRVTSDRSKRPLDLVPATPAVRSDGGAATGRTRESESTLSLLDEFVAGDLIQRSAAGRILASVLFTDIVESTARAAALGDGVWAQILDRHDAIARSAIASCGGRFVKETGDGVLAVFDAPARGIECAKQLRSALAHAGIAIRAGIHTGEIELRGEDVSGIGVHIAARVAALADAGELLVSRTVKDLVAGSEYAFATRGTHRLRGIPERWELLSVH